MDLETAFENLFKLVDIAVILAIMGLSQAIKVVVPDRLMPLVVTALGIGAAFVMTPAGQPWRVWVTAAIYYAGAADLFYTFIWQTILNKINLFDLVANILLKIKNGKKVEK